MFNRQTVITVLAAGARQYVRVLQLLAEYSVKVVKEAIVQCRKKTTVNADHILATYGASPTSRKAL